MNFMSQWLNIFPCCHESDLQIHEAQCFSYENNLLIVSEKNKPRWQSSVKEAILSKTISLNFLTYTELWHLFKCIENTQDQSLLLDCHSMGPWSLCWALCGQKKTIQNKYEASFLQLVRPVSPQNRFVFWQVCMYSAACYPFVPGLP